MILLIRTDKAESELLLYSKADLVESYIWQAGRELSTTIHLQIEQLLHRHNKKLEDIEGIVIFKGPGSFTGLRIGFSVANLLAYSLKIPIISSAGNDWAMTGIVRVLNFEDEKVALPDYGVPAQITAQKK